MKGIIDALTGVKKAYVNESNEDINSRDVEYFSVDDLESLLDEFDKARFGDHVPDWENEIREVQASDAEPRDIERAVKQVEFARANFDITADHVRGLLDLLYHHVYPHFRGGGVLEPAAIDMLKSLFSSYTSQMKRVAEHVRGTGERLTDIGRARRSQEIRSRINGW